MKFEERRARAKSALDTFLSSFAPPRGLSDDAMKSTVANIASAFARRMPITDEAAFSENLEKTFTAIRDHHKGYAWPVQSEFVDAMPKGAYTGGVKPQTYSGDEREAMARRMNTNDAVPESWVWGQLSWPLVAGGMVARDVMDRYRNSSVRNFKDTYGDDAYGKLQEKYGDVVGPYFSQQ